MLRAPCWARAGSQLVAMLLFRNVTFTFEEKSQRVKESISTKLYS